MKFNIGDRVRCIEGSPRGLVGTVKENSYTFAVEFDEEFCGSHGCNGLTDDKRGWYCTKNNVVLVEAKPRMVATKVKCVGYKKHERCFTIGSIYTVSKNGTQITSDEGFTYNQPNGVIDYLSRWYEFEIVEEAEPFNIVFHVKEDVGRTFKKGVTYRVNEGLIEGVRGKRYINSVNELYSLLGRYVVIGKVPLKCRVEDGKLNCRIRITSNYDDILTKGTIVDIVDGKFKCKNGQHTEYPVKEYLTDLKHLDSYFRIGEVKRCARYFSANQINYEVI